MKKENQNGIFSVMGIFYVYMWYLCNSSPPEFLFYKTGEERSKGLTGRSQKRSPKMFKRLLGVVHSTILVH